MGVGFLVGADVVGTDLIGTDLIGTDVVAADVIGADVQELVLLNDLLDGQIFFYRYSNSSTKAENSLISSFQKDNCQHCTAE